MEVSWELFWDAPKYKATTTFNGSLSSLFLLFFRVSREHQEALQHLCPSWGLVACAQVTSEIVRPVCASQSCGKLQSPFIWDLCLTWGSAFSCAVDTSMPGHRACWCLISWVDLRDASPSLWWMLDSELALSATLSVTLSLLLIFSKGQTGPFALLTLFCESSGLLQAAPCHSPPVPYSCQEGAGVAQCWLSRAAWPADHSDPQSTPSIWPLGYLLWQHLFCLVKGKHIYKVFTFWNYLFYLKTQ